MGHISLLENLRTWVNQIAFNVFTKPWGKRTSRSIGLVYQDCLNFLNSASLGHRRSVSKMLNLDSFNEYFCRRRSGDVLVTSLKKNIWKHRGGANLESTHYQIKSSRLFVRAKHILSGDVAQSFFCEARLAQGEKLQFFHDWLTRSQNVATLPWLVILQKDMFWTASSTAIIHAYSNETIDMQKQK